MATRGSLSKKARIDYTNAVQCLQKKPAISSLSDVPGVRSHFDDFVAIHIINTPHVHFGGLFFHFHRYFVWLYEKALREECGYNGAQPYWDWTLSWQDPRKSTVFDGSPTSLGSNGLSIPHGATNLSAFGITVQVTLINSCTDLGCFDTNLEAINGVHASGHFIMGGVGMDPYSSAGDPAFYLHHAQVDRVWTIWQNLNAENRTNQVHGTSTAFNTPPSPNVTLNTTLDYGVLSPQQLVGNLGSTIDGPFCYIYI